MCAKVASETSVSKIVTSCVPQECVVSSPLFDLCKLHRCFSERLLEGSCCQF